jgi:tetratricopeptide (TPR) repeat protein
MVWLYLALFAGQFDSTFHDGLIALNQNNLPLAESRLQAASQLEPHNARVWLALGQTYWKMRKPLQAETAVRNAENWAGNDAVVSNGLSLFYSEAGESYFFEAAQMHLRQQDFAAALATLDAGRKRFDKSAQLELAAGVAYYGLRRFPEAIDAFLRTIDLDPSVDQPYVFLGRMVDQAEGRLPRVTKAFAAYAQRAPDNYLSNFLYGKALALANDPAAEALLRKSIAQNEGYWESHFELGVLLGARRQFDEAAREMRRGADLHPDDPAPHYHLARFYDRLGKPAEAAAERELHARLTAAGQSIAGIK